MTVEERVYAIIALQFECTVESLKPDSRLREDLGADSLDAMELEMQFEQEFDIDILGDIDWDWATNDFTVLQIVNQKEALFE